MDSDGEHAYRQRSGENKWLFDTRTDTYELCAGDDVIATFDSAVAITGP